MGPEGRKDGEKGWEEKGADGLSNGIGGAFGLFLPFREPLTLRLSSRTTYTHEQVGISKVERLKNDWLWQRRTEWPPGYHVVKPVETRSDPGTLNIADLSVYYRRISITDTLPWHLAS